MCSFTGILDDEDPFDAIHVGAAAANLPQVLVNKLKPGGRLIIPVGPRHMFQVGARSCRIEPTGNLLTARETEAWAASGSSNRSSMQC